MPGPSCGNNDVPPLQVQWGAPTENTLSEVLSELTTLLNIQTQLISDKQYVIRHML